MTSAWHQHPIQPVSNAKTQAARDQFARLAGPPGSFGVLEELATRMAGMQNRLDPRADPCQITLFAADHGVCAAGVAGMPPEVSPGLVRNAIQGGSPSAVLARALDTRLEVVDVGLMHDPGDIPGLVRRRIAPGSTDFRATPAMSDQQLHTALTAGREAVERAAAQGCVLFGGGEIGAGKSTAAGAIACALLGLPPESIAGPGSGHGTPELLVRKAAVIQQAVDHHQRFFSTPLDVLRRLGGFDTAALCGAYIACGQLGITAVVDGFCSSVAALVAVTLHPPLKSWMIFGHRAAEPGQFAIFHTLDKRPILNLDMRHGEGTGALAAIPLIRAACALLHESTPPTP